MTFNVARAIARLLKPTQTPWGHSRWETLERCPKEYQLSHVVRVKSREFPRPAILGTAVHRGLAMTYLAEKAGLPPTNASLVAIEAGRESIDVKLEAKRIVSQHNTYWADRDQGWDRIISVERLLQGTIAGVNYSTRIDLLAEKREGKVRLPMLTDHKTTSANRGDPLTEFQASGQLLGMLALWEAIFPKRRRPLLMINRLVKTALPVFDRSRIAIDPRSVARFGKDLVSLNRDRQRYENSGRFPRRYSACIRRYGLCPYFALCHTGGSANAGSYYVPENVNLDEALA